MACHLAHQAGVFEDQALQVLKVLMLASSPAIALKEFIRNLKARVFAHMQTAPLIEAEEYEFPKKRKTDT